MFKTGHNSLTIKLSTLILLAGFISFLPCLSSGQAVSADTLEASDYFNKADTLQKYAHFDSSNHYLNRALPAYRKAEAWERVADCYINISRNFIESGRYDEATDAAADGEKILDDHLPENKKYRSRIFRLRGRVAEETSDYSSALDWHQRALNQLDPDNRRMRAITIFYIGDVHGSQGEYERALDLYFKALDLYNRTDNPDRLFISRIFNNIGITYQNLGKNNSALEYYKKSLDIDRQKYGPDHPDVAAGLNNIAIIYYYDGDYQKALDYMIEATNTLRRYYGEQNPQVAAGYNNISIVFSEMGNLEEAIDYMEKSIAIKKNVFGEATFDVAVGYQNLGALYSDLEQYDRAIKHYREALTLYQQIFEGVHPEIANVYSNLGEAYSRKGEYVRALEFMFKDLEINRNLLGERHPFVGDTYNKIGQTYASGENYTAALEYADRAIAVLTGELNQDEGVQTLSLDNVTYPVFLMESLGNKGEIHRRLYEKNGHIEQLEVALNTYLKASQLIEKMQVEYRSKESKLLLGQRAHDVYQAGIETAYSLYKQTNNLRYAQYALYFSERSKARVLLEQLMEMNARNFAGIPDSLVTMEVKLREKITELNSSLRTKTNRSTHIDSVNTRTLQDSLFTCRQKLNRHIRHLEQNYPKYHQLKYQDPMIRPDFIQKELLQKGETLIEYFVGEESLFAITVSPERVGFHEMGIDSSFNSLIRNFRKTMTEEKTPEFARLSHLIYSRIFQPLISSVRGSRILVVPDGILNYLPFESLISEPHRSPDTPPSDFEYLLRDYTFSYAPSATFLKFWNQYLDSREAAGGSSSSFIGFAPVFSNLDSTAKGSRENRYDRQLVPLPLSRHEVEQAASMIKGRNSSSEPELFVRSAATETAFKQHSAGQFDVIHLATHAFADEENPGIYFAPDSGQTEDGILRLNEIYNLNLKANLVVLSACETGLGEMVRGEGVLSLARAFQYAGAKNLLVSLWKVDDRSTSELMISFYRLLLSGNSTAEAARKAKLELLESSRFASPRFWASFVLIGK